MISVVLRRFDKLSDRDSGLAVAELVEASE
jgi:hypothetical protein